MQHPFVRSTRVCLGAAALTLVLTSVAVASEPNEAREPSNPVNPQWRTDTASPAEAPTANPGNRAIPDAAQPGAPAAVPPEPLRPDEGERATVGQPPVKPEIDPATAAADKPGVEAELAAKPVKDFETVAAESAHERGFANTMNDIYTTARVKLSLAVDSRTSAMDINVDTTDGRVTLFGIVPTDEAKFAAGTDALSIGGVESVDNTLQVVAEDRRPDVLARDAEIQQTLQKSLEPFPSMQGVGIDVKNCVARLTGTVPAGSEHDEAMVAVRKTPGVCQVKDDLRFAAS